MPLLFSYGTLQLPNVQKSLFNRFLDGEKDSLSGFKEVKLHIKDPLVVGLSEKETHIIIEPTNNAEDIVHGIIFELTETELIRADNYETDDYKRELAMFESGKEAWVYVRK